MPVIVQTAHGGIDNVVSAMRAGAVDFVVKPVGAERLQVSLRNALNTSALEGELNRIKHSRSGTLGFKDIITKSPGMQARAAHGREGGGLDHSGADRGQSPASARNWSRARSMAPASGGASRLSRSIAARCRKT